MEGVIIFLVLYSIPCFIVASVFGTARRIGFWTSFGLSFFTTPIGGFIFTMFSETNVKYNDRQKSLQLQQEQLDALKATTVKSSADELHKLSAMLDAGKITQEEFEKMKARIVG